jgi:hypothetical protein
MMPARGLGMNPPIGSSTKHRDPTPSVFGTKKEILVANPPYIIIVKTSYQNNNSENWNSVTYFLEEAQVKQNLYLQLLSLTNEYY